MSETDPPLLGVHRLVSCGSVRAVMGDVVEEDSGRSYGDVTPSPVDQGLCRLYDARQQCWVPMDQLGRIQQEMSDAASGEVETQEVYLQYE